MVKFEWPKQGERWTLEQVQAYSLSLIAEEMAGTRRVLVRQEEEMLRFKLACCLMRYRREVWEIFERHGADSMPLSALRDGITRFGLVWISAEDLRAAIPETDYLAVEPAGSGFRVRLIEETAESAMRGVAG